MADDPLIRGLRKEERNRKTIYFLISTLISYFNSQDKTTFRITDSDIGDDKFKISTVNESGSQLEWIGKLPNKNSVISQLPASKNEAGRTNLDFSNKVSEDQLETEIIIPSKKELSIYVRDQNGTNEIKIVQQFPFPYYREMPIYEKFLCLQALVGKAGMRGEGELVLNIFRKIEYFLLGPLDQEMMDDIRRLVRVGLESSIIKSTNGSVYIDSKILTSRTRFMKIYERYYLKINKTTLYDF